MARREAVLERQARAGQIDELRVLLLGDAGGRVAHQRLARHEQQARIPRFGVVAPVLESRGGMDVRGNALGVERDDRVVVDQHILAPRLVLEFGDVGAMSARL